MNDAKIRVERLNFYYGDKIALSDYLHGHPGPADHRAHRPIGVREIHLFALPEPDERHHCRHAR